MFAANGEVIDRMLRAEELPLPARLNRNPDNRGVVEELFLTVFNRAPDSGERQRSISYLENRPDRRIAAIRQVLWALFNSAEFRMNH